MTVKVSLSRQQFMLLKKSFQSGFFTMSRSGYAKHVYNYGWPYTDFYRCIMNILCKIIIIFSDSK